MERPRIPLRPADQRGMLAAIAEATRAGSVGEVPVGAAVMIGNQLVAQAHNETVLRNDLTPFGIAVR